MSNIQRIRPQGTWVIGSVVDAAEFEALDSMRTKVPNFAEGSVHAPSAPVYVGGEGLRVTGTFEAHECLQLDIAEGGFLNLEAGGTLQVDSAGPGDTPPAAEISVNGRVIVKDGGLLQIAAGGFARSSGDFACLAGSTLQIANAAVLRIDPGGVLSVQGGATPGALDVYGAGTWRGASNYPKLSPARTVHRRSLSIASTSGAAGVAKAWKAHNDSFTGGDRVVTAAATAAGDYTLLELEDLPDGATLQTVQITTRGIAGTNALNRPTYYLVRWRGHAPLEQMSNSTTDAHSIPDWANITPTATTITCNAHEVIDRSYRYGVKVLHPYEAGGASMEIFDAVATLSVSELRL